MNLISQRIKLIEGGQNPFFVRELESGYVVLGDDQLFYGYTLFLCKKNSRELHELSPSFRACFLAEMSLVAQAVFDSFKPDKLNYELLGNAHPHLHWHIIPRYRNDPAWGQPIWILSPEQRKKTLSTKEVESMKQELLQALDRYL